MSAIPLRRDIHYPESDGKPMGETEIHIREIIYLFEALNEHLREMPEVYVGADMLLYYVEGNPRTFVVPDVFVTRGVPRGERRTYKLWEEGRPPSLIVEVTSDSTRNEDVFRKKALYEQLGVEEYVLYDPLQDYLSPAFAGLPAGGRPLSAHPHRGGRRGPQPDHGSHPPDRGARDPGASYRDGRAHPEQRGSPGRVGQAACRARSPPRPSLIQHPPAPDRNSRILVGPPRIPFAQPRIPAARCRVPIRPSRCAEENPPVVSGKPRGLSGNPRPPIRPSRRPAGNPGRLIRPIPASTAFGTAAPRSAG